MPTIQLIYSAENSNVASQIDAQLSQASFRFVHLQCRDADLSPALYDKLRQSEEKVLLLISDNFLKSSQCMYTALPMLTELKQSDRLIPVIIDGMAIDEQTGNIVKTPTKFERVGDVIQYMNYWQEQYLDMRKKKRSLHPDQEERFNEQLKVVRTISTQVGEFLRQLRGIEYISFEELSANHFEAFFTLSGYGSMHADFARNAPSTPPTEERHKPESGITPPVTESKPNAEAISDSNVELEETETAPEANVVENLEGLESRPLQANPKDIIDEILNDEQSGADSGQEGKKRDYSYQALDDLFEEEGDGTDGLIEDIEVIPKTEFDEMEIEELDIEIELSEPLLTKSQRLEQIKQQIDAGQLDAARPEFEKLVADFADDPLLRYQFADYLYHKKQDIPAAKLQYEAIIGQDRKHLAAYHCLAEIAELQNDFLLAKSYYEKIYSLDKNTKDIAFKLGFINQHYLSDKADIAEDYYKKAIRQNPDHAESHYQMAIILNEHQNKPDKAIKHFRKTLKLQPNHPFANYDLAILYHRLGEMKTAADFYKKAYTINPELKTPENDRAFTILVNPPKRKGQKQKGKTNTNGKTKASEGVAAVDVLVKEDEPAAKPATETEKTPKPKSTPPASQKTVMITGATSGIGLATAELFAQNGYRIILTGRRKSRLQSIVKRLKKETESTQFKSLCFDVRDSKAIQSAIKKLPKAWREVDILINNAGLAKGYGPIHEGKQEDWEAMIDTNIKGLLYMSRLVSPQMVERGKGHIINICSTAGREVYPNGNVYCATKFAVEGLTRSMRLDLYKHGIRVSQVSPGHVEETEFAEVRFDGDKERAKIYEDFQPLKAKDVAEAIYFIATRPAYVNVQDILMTSSQQAGNNHIDRSGRKDG